MGHYGLPWHSKPKVVEGTIFFRRWGRTSEVTNRFLNLLVAHLTGFGTEAIRTGNAGEHALTMELALRIGFGSGSRWSLASCWRPSSASAGW